jgi:hypothetical protein
MSGPDGDNELEAFLARRSLMHRRFAEGDPSEPPAELDRIVLAKAREAIKRSADTPVYRSPQWAMPVGLAASLLLVFAVVLNFVHVSNQRPQVAAALRTTAPQESTVSDVRELPAETKIAPAAAPGNAKAEAYVPPVASNEAQLKRSQPAPVEQLAKTAPSALAQNERRKFRDERNIAGAAGPSAPSVDSRTELDRASAAAKRQDADAHRDTMAGTSIVSGVVPSPSGDAPPLTASTRSGITPEWAREATASDSGLIASTQETKPPPVDEIAREPSKDESKQAYTASTNAASGSTLEESVVTSPRRVRGGGKRPAVPNAPAAIALEKAKHPNPDDWLRDIGELRSAGRIEEANHQLEMFRRAYPDHSIPSAAAEQPPPAQ